jgi:hypothetical protein
VIEIQKSETADTRTCDFANVSKQTLLESSVQHIGDVRRALAFFQAALAEAATRHDTDKITDIDGFHRDFVTGFKQTEWWDRHRALNRHHLFQADGVPQDVNLIDVLDLIADCVMAGMARSGRVYPLNIDADVLMRAFQNTVDLLKANVIVASGPAERPTQEPIAKLLKSVDGEIRTLERTGEPSSTGYIIALLQRASAALRAQPAPPSEEPRWCEKHQEAPPCVACKIAAGTLTLAAPPPSPESERWQQPEVREAFRMGFLATLDKTSPSGWSFDGPSAADRWPEAWDAYVAKCETEVLDRGPRATPEAPHTAALTAIQFFDPVTRESIAANLRNLASMCTDNSADGFDCECGAYRGKRPHIQNCNYAVLTWAADALAPKEQANG